MRRYLGRAIVGLGAAAAAMVGFGVTASPTGAPDFSVLLGGGGNTSNPALLELRVTVIEPGSAPVTVEFKGIGIFD